MDKVYWSSTDLCCLDKLHTRSSSIVLGFEYCHAWLVVIREEYSIIWYFCIFEIVPCCLYLIEFTVFSRSNRSIKGIPHNDDIIWEAIPYFRRYCSEDYCTIFWCWNSLAWGSRPILGYIHRKTRSSICYEALTTWLFWLSSRKSTACKEWEQADRYTKTEKHRILSWENRGDVDIEPSSSKNYKKKQYNKCDPSFGWGIYVYHVFCPRKTKPDGCNDE